MRQTPKFGPAVHTVFSYFERGCGVEYLEENFFPILCTDGENFPQVPIGMYTEEDIALITAAWRKIHAVSQSALHVIYEFEGAHGRVPDMGLEFENEAWVVDVKTGSPGYVPTYEDAVRAYEQTVETARELEKAFAPKPVIGRILFFANTPGMPLRWEWRKPRRPDRRDFREAREEPARKPRKQQNLRAHGQRGRGR